MKKGGHCGAKVWRRILTSLGIGAGLCVAASAGAGPNPGQKAPEELRQAGPYLLRTRILQAGTRSEGRVGRLFLNGAEVPGRAPGEFIEIPTPAGTVRFTYLGEARPWLWSVSGWTDRGL